VVREREVGDIKVGILDYLDKIDMAKRIHEHKMQDMIKLKSDEKESKAQF
jgi:hypothetical protein